MSNVSVFGQSAQKLVDDSTIEVNSNAKKRKCLSSFHSIKQYEFCFMFLWYKQDPNGTISKESSSAKYRL
jgi:hypothetical protein